MFSYYGSKSKLVGCYPYPKYDKIIEPFAGSARYSLKHFEKEVLLVDKYEIIIKIWKWLQKASERDIMNLPEPEYKEDIRNYNLSEDERNLLSFLVARGVSSPQYIVQQFSDIKSAKKQIAQQLFKIRHWEIKHGDYRNIPNEESTWFIDPPYQFGGEHYKINNIEYQPLATWCKERMGQVIVCENSKASWLPFRQMAALNGAYGTTQEVIWSNQQTVYDNEQLSLL